MIDKNTGGSGIYCDVPGQRCFFDVQGKWTGSTFEATYLGVFGDDATRWGRGYGMRNKKAMKAGLALYVAYMASNGKRVTKAI
jgi:hypothetical protein